MGEADELYDLLGIDPAPDGEHAAGRPPSISPLLDLAPPAPFDADRFAPRPRRVADVVAVFSPKGGVGKTTISVTLGAVLARRGRARDGSPLKVCLVDLDLFGDVGARLGRVAPTVLDLARAHPSPTAVTVGEFLVDERASGLRLLLAPLRPDAANRSVLTPRFYREVITALAACHDVVILDCGTELVDPVLAATAIPAADRLLFVVNNEAATLASARTALDLVVAAPIGCPRRRISLVLNQRADGVGLGDAEVLARLPHADGIAVRLPDDRQLFVGAANRGRPLLQSADPRVEDGLRRLAEVAVPGVHLTDLDLPVLPADPVRRRLPVLLTRLVRSVTT